MQVGSLNNFNFAHEGWWEVKEHAQEMGFAGVKAGTHLSSVHRGRREGGSDRLMKIG